MFNTYNNLKTEPCQEPLYDIRSNGKVNPWNEKKCSNIELAHLIAKSRIDNNFRKAGRIYNCGHYLWFNVDDMENMKLANARFCKYRLCPTCIWRKSLKLYHQMEQIFSALDKKKYQWCFLTLTVKNCYSSELSSTIDAMLKGFDRMLKRRKVKDVVVGYYRGLEVTYNRKTDTYHPHIHVLLQLTPSYIKGTKYIKQSEWRSIWQECMRLEYNPVVDIRKVRPGYNSETGEYDNMLSAVCECTKYPVKDSEYIHNNGTVDEVDKDIRVIETLDSALFNRRMVHFGGMLAKIHKELHLQDVEDGNLVFTDDEDNEKIIPVLQKCFAFNTGYMQYYKVDQILYEPDEQKRISDQRKIECVHALGEYTAE